MVEGILRGLLCCERNNAVKGFLLPVVVHAKEREEEGKVLAVGGLGLVGGGRSAFIGMVILWIALGFGVGLFAGCMCVVGVFKVCGLQREREMGQRGEIDRW